MKLPRWLHQDMLLLVATLVFSALGQFYFQRRPAFFWDGVAFYLIGLGSFVVLLQRLRGKAFLHTLHLSQAIGWAGRNWLRFVLAGLAFLSAILALRTIRTHPSHYWGALGLWLGGMVLYVGAFLPSWAEWRGFLARGWGFAQGQRREIALVCLLTGVALALRVMNLEGAPGTLAGDEGSMGVEAVGVLEGRIRNMFVTGWSALPTMHFFLVAASMKLFGTGIFGLRMVSALAGTATVPLFYLMVRRLFGRRLALAGTTYLCFYHFHLHFSRIAIHNIEDPLFFILTLHLLYEGLRSGRGIFFALAGLAMGLAQYLYAGARLIPVVALVYLGFLSLKEQGFLSQNWGRVLVFLAGAVVAALPLAVYFWAHPDIFNARVNQVGIIQSGWLRREVEITGGSTVQLLIQQFVRAFLAFNLFPDRSDFYGLRGPLLDFISGMMFLLGLTYALCHWRDRRYLVLLFWFWLAIVIGGMLTVTPPNSTRLVGLTPVVSLLVVIGLERVVELGARVLKLPAFLSPVVIGGVVLYLGLASVHMYFYRYLPTMVYGSFNAEVATVMGKYLAKLGEGYRCYFFGPPRIYYGFPSIPFLARGVEGVDMGKPQEGALEAVKVDKDAAFIFLPEREGELIEVERRYPGGKLVYFQGQLGGPELFLSYEVERAKLEGR